jgi:hypothetical protein
VNTKHPITPPEELVEEWGRTVLIDYSDTHWGYEQILCAMAARWGADMELEACCALMDDWGLEASDLRAARRPKPPSLKEQALGALGRFHTNAHTRADEMDQDFDLIRRALEAQ